ncbi:hypothetical protein OESDEN_24657, partial [Oesophagostomum dentatum]
KVPLRCDCPCGCITDDYVQFGLCDHCICRSCYDTTKRVDRDGLRGCCNAECLDLAQQADKQKRKDARKEKHFRAKRVRSEASYCMEYDDEDLEKQMEKLWKTQKLAVSSAQSESIIPSKESITSQS